MKSLRTDRQTRRLVVEAGVAADLGRELGGVVERLVRVVHQHAQAGDHETLGPGVT